MDRDDGFLFICSFVIVSSNIPLDTGSAQNSKTVAGGYALGSATNEHCFPYGVVVDDDQTTVIVTGAITLK